MHPRYSSHRERFLRRHFVHYTVHPLLWNPLHCKMLLLPSRFRIYRWDVVAAAPTLEPNDERPSRWLWRHAVRLRARHGTCILAAVLGCCAGPRGRSVSELGILSCVRSKVGSKMTVTVDWPEPDNIVPPPPPSTPPPASSSISHPSALLLHNANLPTGRLQSVIRPHSLALVHSSKRSCASFAVGPAAHSVGCPITLAEISRWVQHSAGTLSCGIGWRLQGLTEFTSMMLIPLSFTITIDKFNQPFR